MSLKRFLPLLLCLFLFSNWAQASAVDTRVSLVIGFPDSEVDSAEEGALLVPGTVIPMGVVTKPLPADADSLAASSLQLAQLREKLAQSLRLERLDYAYSEVLALEVGSVQPLEGPPGASPVSLQIELLGHNATTASYRVKLFEDARVIANSPLTIERGASAVVGGLDGEDAPYLFLVVSALPKQRVEGPFHVEGDIERPRAIYRASPQYTKEAKEAGIEGLVILQAVIDQAGAVGEVKILQGLSHGLDEAAVEAIRLWSFEPATLDGKPVEVYYNLTINFRLPDKPKDD